MKQTKKFNPSMGHAFSNNKFGENSVLVALTAENIKTFTENAQIGGSILLRFNKPTTKGNNHFFVEILPPLEGKKTTGKKAEYSELE